MHSVTRYLCIIVAVLSIVYILILLVLITDDADINDFCVTSDDSDIYIDWVSDDLNQTDEVVITLCDKENLKLEYQIPAYAEEFHFRDGVHGKLYHVSISIKNAKGNTYDIGDFDRLFLDYDQLPHLPLMSISTYEHNEPSYDLAKKPDDKLWGASMVNNEYVSGNLEYQILNGKKLSTKVDIKCRGNTSSVESAKKSYRIHFDSCYDFLQDQTEKYQDWILLHTGTNLNFFVGNFTGSQCGMEWSLTGMLVNVMLNGDWKGTYYLTPQVGIASSNGLVEKDGFIIENDAYWWKEDEIYFKTKNQVYQQGYTFKYPKLKSRSNASYISISAYMQQIEDSIINNNYQELIDERSFAKWILARDLVGVADGGGSNQYYYLKSISDPSGKLKMGPLWDWDSTRLAGTWSRCRDSNVSYFGYLFSYDSFQETYRTEYGKASAELLENLRNEFDNLNNYNDEINESWALDAQRWKHSYVSLEEMENSWLDWFTERISWMDINVYS